MNPGQAFCNMCGTRAEYEQQAPEPENTQESQQFEPEDTMGFCMECGAKLQPDQAFCIQCGARVENKTDHMTETSENTERLFDQMAVEELEPDKTEQRFCNQCGSEIHPGQVFCNQCGNKL